MEETLKNSFVIVTPVYEDADASRKLFQALGELYGNQAYIVAVDDGSVQYPVDASIIENAKLQGVVLKLIRNVGHQRAIAIGLNYVAEHINTAQRVIVMDSDGEDLPASIKELLRVLDSDPVDIVVAERKSRVETLQFRIFYVIYKWIFRSLSGHKIGFGNFMALGSTALKRLVNMHELWIHVAGCALASRLRIVNCPLDRGPRHAGTSKMNFVALVLHGFKGLMIFAEDVLVRVGIVCALIAVFSVLGGAAAIILKVLGIATPGWFSVALGILFLVFLQTGALTLMTLMLTGIVKGGVVSAVDYEKFIDIVQHTNNRATA